MNRTIVLLLFILNLCLTTLGQESLDTIIIQDVIISNTRIEYFNDGAKKEIIDSSALLLLPSSTLSDVLLSTTPALLKSYGHSGAASNISLRGGGANRTQILWEGFPINSVTMGESDLSLIPTSCFNYIAIDHSASGTNYGSGTFGGAIQLSHTPIWKEHQTYSISMSQGSFESYNMHAQHSIGNKRIESSGTYFASKSASNFTYYDYINLDTLQRKNAEFYKYGFIQNIQYRITNKTLLSAGLWYNVKDNKLPAIIGSDPNNAETQRDSTCNAFVQIKKQLPKSLLIIKSGYLYGYQLYTKKLTPSDSVYTTYSDITNKKNINSILYRYYISSKVTAHIEYENNYLKAQVDNYAGEITEHIQHAIGAIRYSHNKIHANIGIRKEFEKGRKTPLIYSGGIDYALSTIPCILRINTGKKYRTPTFNDLYWIGWGNPDLKPEYGYSHEIGLQYNIISKQKNKLVTDIAAYRSTIYDMILWAPNGNVWNPLNLAKAQLEGIELRLKHIYSLQSFVIKNNIGIDYNNSHIADSYTQEQDIIGQQLYYVPKISISYSPNLQYKSWYFGATTNFQSKRFFSKDNILDSFFTADAYIKYRAATNKMVINYNLTIKNITNTNYELIKSYPMPGRYFEFGIQLIFNK